MVYLLDTSAFSDLMHGDTQTMTHVNAVGPTDDVVICAIVRGELLFGIKRLDDGARKSKLRDVAANLFEVIPCESIPSEAGTRYAAVKLNCQRSGLAVDENDLWIAATALALGATLVSRDSDFRRIDGLLLQDWSR